MLVSYGIILIVVTLGASAHLMLRAGMDQVGRVGAEQLSQPISLLTSVLTNPLVLTAVPLYAASFVAWTVVLSRLQLSLAYPGLAMTYVLIPLASWGLLHEPISRSHWVGLAVIVIGVLLVLRAGLP